MLQDDLRGRRIGEAAVSVREGPIMHADFERRVIISLKEDSGGGVIQLDALGLKVRPELEHVQREAARAPPLHANTMAAGTPSPADRWGVLPSPSSDAHRKAQDQPAATT